MREQQCVVRAEGWELGYERGDHLAAAPESQTCHWTRLEKLTFKSVKSLELRAWGGRAQPVCALHLFWCFRRPSSPCRERREDGLTGRRQPVSSPFGGGGRVYVAVHGDVTGHTDTVLWHILTGVLATGAVRHIVRLVLTSEPRLEVLPPRGRPL